MLTDEKPRFSIRDIGLIVSLSAVGVLAYANMLSAQHSLSDRVEAVELHLKSDATARLPERMARLEYILCATDDRARALACERMGVLR